MRRFHSTLFPWRGMGRSAVGVARWREPVGVKCVGAGVSLTGFAICLGVV